MKDFNINMSEFDLLDPNNYTEGKNPILSTLFHTVINDKLGNNSNEVKEMIAANSEQEKFTDTLSSEQLELYNNAYWEQCSIDAKIEAERFILGFKFALMLIKEGLKPWGTKWTEKHFAPTQEKFCILSI